MSNIYITALGDTWDSIALSVYGDVKYAEYLAEQNQDETLLKTVIFGAGISVSAPDLPEDEETDDSTPPWR